MVIKGVDELDAEKICHMLIDCLGMPDFAFKFLLNYINHGIKKLISIPLVAKHASRIVIALFTIFLE